MSETDWKARAELLEQRLREEKDRLGAELHETRKKESTYLARAERAEQKLAQITADVRTLVDALERLKRP